MIEIEKRAGEWVANIDGAFYDSDVCLESLLYRLSRRADDIEWELEYYDK